jgi:hypothetical protein
MNLTNMQTFVSALAGDESNVQFTLVQITQYLNWAQKEMCRRLEFFQKTATVTTLDSGHVDGQGGAILPADFAQELHVFWGNNKIAKTAYSTFYDQLGGGVGTENPSYYALQDFNSTPTRRMVFWPYQNPGRVGLDIDVIYTAQPPDLAVGADVPVLPDVFHEAMCLYALAKCKLQENDYAAYKLVHGDYQARMLELSSFVSEADGFSYPIIRSANENISTLDA